MKNGLGSGCSGFLFKLSLIVKGDTAIPGLVLRIDTCKLR